MPSLSFGQSEQEFSCFWRSHGSLHRKVFLARLRKEIKHAPKSLHRKVFLARYAKKSNMPQNDHASFTESSTN